MHCGRIAIALAVLVAAGPALAQWGGVGGPNPVEQATAPKKHHPARKSAPRAAKPADIAATKIVVAKPEGVVPTPKPAAGKDVPVGAEPERKETTASAPAELTGISPAERLKIQSALYWSGDFATAAKGGGALEEAVRNFQKRNKSKVTGVLTAEQRAALIAAANSHEQEFGWNVVVDPATGVRIGLPTKLVPNARDAEHGTRWSSPHGEVQVETFRVKDANLSALFESEKKKAKRKIEHSALGDDNFIISGMQGLKLFTVRAKQRDGEVRGFTLLYDQMMEGIVAPVMVAMASAFSPFPERPAPFATLEKKVEYGTGLIVSAEGHVLTARRVAQGCQVIVADGLGNAERIAEDEANGLALLRVYGMRKLPALPLAREAPTVGDVTLVGIPDPREQNGAKRLAEIKARLAGGSALALPRPVPMAGFAGAAAIDAKGSFAGVMITSSFALASAEPTLPPVRLIGADAIRDFLAKHNVPLTGAAGGDARAAAVRVICVRQ
jgi:hypothetical protein